MTSPGMTAESRRYNSGTPPHRQDAARVRSEQQARLVDEERPWTGRHYTIDEFLALPDETPHLEFDNGVVTQKVAAKPTHSSVQFLLTTLFNQVAHPR